MRIFKALLFILLPFTVAVQLQGQTRTIHVFVALCDNQNQGIVPVPPKLGNGQNPATNLYWGAAYGVKTFFKSKTAEWQLVATPTVDDATIHERLLFKHATEDAYLLADAYDGAAIQGCIEAFLLAANGQNPVTITHQGKTLPFGGGAQLMAYTGHDGLMEFDVNLNYGPAPSPAKEAIILACYSKDYFKEELRKAQATPLLWTTHLMAPEAYTLKAAIDGWLANEAGTAIDERAAQAYHKYQKCGIRGARNLFTTGY